MLARSKYLEVKGGESYLIYQPVPLLPFSSSPRIDSQQNLASLEKQNHFSLPQFEFSGSLGLQESELNFGFAHATRSKKL